MKMLTREIMMKTNKGILIAAVFLLLPSVGFQSIARSEEVKKQPEQKVEKVEATVDPFLGEYISDSRFNGDEGESFLTITKEGNYYRLNDPKQELKDYQFVKKSERVLISERVLQGQNHRLGTIILGHLVFEGEDKPQIVLRVRFAYRFGLLFKQPDVKR